MKTILSLCLSLLASCGGFLTPEEQETYDQLALVEIQAKADLDVAKASGDAGAVAAAEEKLGAVEKDIARLEVGAAERQFGPIWSVLYSLPVVGGMAKLAGPFLGTLLLPLASKRGRKHYGAMVKELTPWAPGKDGEKGIGVAEAGTDLLRAWGIKHSSAASAKAA